ncbi:unnamed protein product [Angiostrongylus costaricensis]|uniref:Reverse transcriptase domain-containing protein n=1 Tax=Angiostrongylus costaricensis TaxID=334426 RepID=A0A0R3PXS1_ANGCS|nr:unnamed protein product [Angiostrongylus costaricensis]
MFLDRLRSARPNSAFVVESFDVTALYTNVSNDSAMQAINELLIQHDGAINMYDFSIQQLMTLLKECLNCSIFRWSGRYYAQMRGPVMGQRLAPYTTRWSNKYVRLLDSAVDDTLKGVPELLNLQMVREVLRTNERAGNGTTTGSKPCHCIHV